ncbi:hypothetical protein ACHAXS_008301, partial [Conticribra weissflogii]
MISSHHTQHNIMILTRNDKNNNTKSTEKSEQYLYFKHHFLKTENTANPYPNNLHSMNSRLLLHYLPIKSPQQQILRQRTLTHSNWPKPHTQSRQLSCMPNPAEKYSITTKAFKSMNMSTSSSPSSKQRQQRQQQERMKPTKCPNLTLYGDLNMRPFRNVWMLEETNLPYNHVPCRPWGRKAKTVHPLGKVPSLLVEFPPNIDENSGGTSAGDHGHGYRTGDNTLVILESAAINTYLGDLARELRAMPPTTTTKDAFAFSVLVPPPATPQRAKYDSLAFFIMTELDAQSLWIHRKHDDLKDIFGGCPTAVREAKRQFDNAMGVMLTELEDCSKDGPFDDVDGDVDSYYLIPSFGFSAVDILFVHCCNWAQKIGWLEQKKTSSLSSPSKSALAGQIEKEEESGSASLGNDDGD